MSEDISENKSEVLGGESNILNKENILLQISCLLLGFIGNYLFFGKIPGISYPLFVILLYVAFLYNLRKKIKPELNFHWLLTVPILMLTATFAIYSNILFLVLNFLLVPLLIIIQTTLIAGVNKYKWFDFRFIEDIVLSLFVRPLNYINKPFSLIKSIIVKRFKVLDNENAIKIVIGLLISSVLLIVIVPLLIAADGVFENLFERIPNLFNMILTPNMVGQIIFISVVSIITFSYIFSFTVKKNESKVSNVSIENKKYKFVDPVIMTTIFCVVNFVYIVFVIIQFTYLFGGMLPSNSTYAEYARRGFFELSFITVINLGILAFDLNLTENKSVYLNKFLKALRTILVACTMVMVFSAFYRMWMYEVSFGFTMLRVLTHSFMIYIFVLLCATFLKIWNNRFSLLKSFVIVSIAAYLFLNYLNIDAFIINKNMDRYRLTHKIDINYLNNLSNDAIPQMVTLFKMGDTKINKELKPILNERLSTLTKPEPWQSFNFSKSYAKEVLNGIDKIK